MPTDVPSQTGNVLLLTDGRGAITGVGGPATELLRRAPDQLVGMNITAVTGLSLDELLDETGPGRRDRAERQLPPPSREAPVAIMTARVEPGPVLAVIISPATATELDTTRDANLALATSNRQLEAFASVAAHDLQEPLRKIRAFTDRVQGLLADQGPTDQVADYLNRVDSAAARMQTLISDLLALARVSGRIPEREPTDLNQVLDQVKADLGEEIAATGADVTVGPMPTLLVDRGQFRQLFTNLVSNSLKYRHPERSPHVTMAARHSDHDVTITIEDNGIGFDDQYLPKIFAPFERLWGRDEYPGTGVGLALCREIVRRHDGTITAHGRPGEGAEFVINLPRSGR